MIVLINGPFGVGKTTAAHEVIPLLPNAMLFDPEEVGAGRRRPLEPLGATDDYQGLPLWRALRVDLAARVQTEYGRHLIMPMAILRRNSFEEVTHGLRARDIPMTCFRLVASRETLTQHIISRPDGEDSHA